MTNQALFRKTVTETLTYVNKPAEATIKNLMASGFAYDSKSRQWFCSVSEAAVIEESVAAGPAA